MMVVPRNLKIWDSLQGQNIRDKAIFVTDTVNPQVDIQPTWKCEIWVRDVDLQKPGSNKDSEGKPKIPEHITCQAACAYDIYGKCTGMLSLERLNICYMLKTNLNGLAYTVLHNHLCKMRQLNL